MKIALLQFINYLKSPPNNEKKKKKSKKKKSKTIAKCGAVKYLLGPILQSENVRDVYSIRIKVAILQGTTLTP